MTISNHQTIMDYLEQRGIDPYDILEANKLEDFSKCKINAGGAVMFAESGRILRGSPSANRSGRSKEDATLEKEANQRLVDFMPHLKTEFETTGNISTVGYKKFLDLLLLECKTTREGFEFAAQYSKFYVGAKQTIETENKEERRIVISFGSPETTELIKNVTPAKEIADE
jgi:hypothetical protein